MSRPATPVAVALVAVVAVLAGGGAMLLGSGIGVSGPGGRATTLPSPGGSAGVPSTTPPGLVGAAGAPSPAPTAAMHREAIVPVTGFRAAWDSTGPTEVSAILAGSSRRYRALELPREQAPQMLAALGQAAGASSSRLVLAPDAASLRRDLARHPGRLGFLALSDVEPSVRALGWGGASLFGVGRVAAIADWPLAMTLPGPAPGTGAGGGYDPAAAWTLVATGDINLDGTIAVREKTQRRGVDYVFDGGTATITGHRCCSAWGNPLPTYRRTGDAGAVRDVLAGADLALGNFENPAPDAYALHLSGFTFTADPALIEGLRNAGFDWLSLANNHILNAGGAGLLQTISHLDRWGISHSGAGANLAAARRPAMLHAGGLTVAVLGYDTIRPDFGATRTRPGTNEMSAARVRADVAAARAAGADLVVVFPHWGVEYTARTTATQRSLARAAVDAGADVVIGSHPHWAGGVEVYKGRPIFYSLGDFVFDIARSEQTLEGIVPELTFMGTRLVQVRIRPYLIVDLVQPSWLDPAASGAVVMSQVFGASDRLPW